MVAEFGVKRPVKILSLDGGGAKGFYTLGVLRQLEALLDTRLSESFDLVFGTSTGAIIAALIGLGHSVEEIHSLYKEHVPRIMQRKKPTEKSQALADLAGEVFKDSAFTDMKTGVGIVATKWVTERPMIFKGNLAQAHGMTASFVPGFGVSVADAVQASCSAFPFFDRKIVHTSAGDDVELIDGGYCANNPTLYAIADAHRALGVAPEHIRVMSIGVGIYPTPTPKLFSKMWLAKYLLSVQLLQKTLEINTQSMDQLRSVLYSHVPTVRISDTFERPEMATDLFEHDLTKLNLIRQMGTDSFASRENEIKSLLGVS